MGTYIPLNRIRLQPLWVWLVLLSLLAAAAAVTYASVRGGGISGSGRALGRIQQFRSVVVNNYEFFTSAVSSFTIDGLPASESDFEVGQRITVDATSNFEYPDTISYRSDLIGPVEAVLPVNEESGEMQLQIFGQTVSANVVTNVLGTALDYIEENDVLEISGNRLSNADLEASFVRDRGTPGLYKVVGRVTNPGPYGQNFTIGALQVDCTVCDPVVSGLLVEVSGGATSYSVIGSASHFTADSALVLPSVSLANGEYLEIEGHIGETASPTDFDINGQQVHLNSGTVFLNGTSADLARDAKVEARGRGDSNGVLVADTVVIKSTKAVVVRGQIDAIDLLGSTLTALGVTLEVRNETSFGNSNNPEVNVTSLADLNTKWNAGEGEVLDVKVVGYLDGESLVATKVDGQTPMKDTRIRGIVQGTGNAEDHFDLLGSTIQVDEKTKFSDAQGKKLTLEEFFENLRVGKFLQVRWKDFKSLSDPADKVGLE